MSERFRQMGEGRIGPEEMETEVRIIRHNLLGVMGAQGMQGDLLRDAISRSAGARELVDQNTIAVADLKRDVYGLKYDIYGHPDRKDDMGMMGQLRAEIAAMRKQQWMILMALVVATLAVITDLVVKLATHAA